MFDFALNVGVWKGLDFLISKVGRLGTLFKVLGAGVSIAGAAITAIGALFVGMIGSISTLSSKIGEVQDLEKHGSGINLNSSNDSLKSQLEERQKLLDKAKQDAQDYDSFWSSPISHIFQTDDVNKALELRKAKVYQGEVSKLSGELEHRSLVGQSVQLEQRRFNFGSTGSGPDRQLQLQQQQVDYLRIIANNSKAAQL